MRTGPIVSSTMTWKLALALLKAASVATHVTSVSPKGKMSPETTVTGVPPRLRVHTTPALRLTASNADTEKVAGAPPAWVASSRMVAGTLIVGPSRSTTRTTNDARTVLPEVSTVSQLTGVSPSANTLPDGGTQSFRDRIQSPG